MSEGPAESFDGMRKLVKPPIKVEVFFNYRYNKQDPEYKGDEPDEVQPDPESMVEAWLHPMTRDQALDVEGVYVEAYRRWKDKREATDEEAKWAGARVSNIQQLAYCLRVGPDRKAAPLMTDREAMELNAVEATRLVDLYAEEFVPTKDERKNSFRARAGSPSGKPSSSPNTSEGQP